MPIFIPQGLKKIHLHFKLDKITGGTGSCFPISVLQQLRRPELFETLDEDLKFIVESMDPTALRHMVAHFMLTSPEVEDIRNLNIAQSEDEWIQYWTVYIINPSNDATELFILSTAIFLKKDIYITSRTHTISRPFQTFSGHRTDRDSLAGGPCLFIGYDKDQMQSIGHYQSILPLQDDDAAETEGTGLSL